MDIQAKASSSVRWSLFTVPIATWDSSLWTDICTSGLKMVARQYADRWHSGQSIYPLLFSSLPARQTQKWLVITTWTTNVNQNAYDAKMLSLAYRLHIYMYIYLFVEFTREHFFITFTMTLQLFIWKGTKTTINGVHAILFIPFKVQGGWNQGDGPLMPYVPGPHSFRCFKLHRFVVEIKMNSELE